MLISPAFFCRKLIPPEKVNCFSACRTPYPPEAPQDFFFQNCLGSRAFLHSKSLFGRCKIHFFRACGALYTAKCNIASKIPPAAIYSALWGRKSAPQARKFCVFEHLNSDLQRGKWPAAGEKNRNFG